MLSSHLVGISLSLAPGVSVAAFVRMNIGTVAAYGFALEVFPPGLRFGRAAIGLRRAFAASPASRTESPASA